MAEGRGRDDNGGDDSGGGADDSGDALVACALAALERAYAPYSGFRVGCALLAEGQVYEGANIENASYGVCLCAERTALAAAVYAGARSLGCVIVSSESAPPAAPCGVCLQALSEFCDDPAALRVVLVNPQGARRTHSLAAAFPYGFNKRQLDG